jgi:hypothetical protein
LANTLVPQSSEKGALLSTPTGIVHVTATFSDMSQEDGSLE